MQIADRIRPSHCGSVPHDEGELNMSILNRSALCSLLLFTALLPANASPADSRLLRLVPAGAQIVADISDSSKRVLPLCAYANRRVFGQNMRNVALQCQTDSSF